MSNVTNNFYRNSSSNTRNFQPVLFDDRTDAYKDPAVLSAWKEYAPTISDLVCHDKAMSEKYGPRMKAFTALKQARFDALDKKYGLTGKNGLHSKYEG